MIRGNEDRFPTRVRMPDGSVLKGNPDAPWTDLITLPDGRVIRGRTVGQREAQKVTSNG